MNIFCTRWNLEGYYGNVNKAHREFYQHQQARVSSRSKYKYHLIRCVRVCAWHIRIMTRINSSAHHVNCACAENWPFKMYDGTGKIFIVSLSSSAVSTLDVLCLREKAANESRRRDRQKNIREITLSVLVLTFAFVSYSALTSLQRHGNKEKRKLNGRRAGCSRVHECKHKCGTKETRQERKTKKNVEALTRTPSKLMKFYQNTRQSNVHMGCWNLFICIRITKMRILERSRSLRHRFLCHKRAIWRRQKMCLSMVSWWTLFRYLKR